MQTLSEHLLLCVLAAYLEETMLHIEHLSFWHGHHHCCRPEVAMSNHQCSAGSSAVPDSTLGDVTRDLAQRLMRLHTFTYLVTSAQGVPSICSKAMCTMQPCLPFDCLGSMSLPVQLFPRAASSFSMFTPASKTSGWKVAIVEPVLRRLF